MGFIRDLIAGRRNPILEAAEHGPGFAVDADSIDPAVFGLTSYVSPIPSAARISRREAIQVPAVKGARDLIATTLGTLPIDVFGPDKQPSRSSLLEQPEKNVPRSVTMTKTFEDLLFEGIAWWRVIEFGWHTFPVKVRRLNPRNVTVDEDSGRVYVNGKHVPSNELIRFDSPNDGLLIAAARAIRTCLHLDQAAGRFSDGAPPIDYFTPADGSDPADDEEIESILNDWADARRVRGTAYVPAGLKYNVAGWSPKDLQLADARNHAVLEISRAARIDAEELGVSTTSRTYANQFDRRKAFLDFTLGGYISAVQDRLSMGDVTPRGYTARFNLDAFLRSDTKTRFETYEIGLRVGALDHAEIRQLEDKQPLDNPPAPQEATTVDAAQPAEITFDAGPAIRLDAPQTGEHFEVNVEKRTIRGLLVPYGVAARSRGQLFQFSQGSLKFAAVSRVKLWIQHDPTQAVGVATELDDRPEGLFGVFKVARGEDGDRALMSAEDGVLDGFSIGLSEGGKYRRDRNGVNHAVEVPLMETSLTPAPSFDDARVHAVAASAATTTGESMESEDQDQNTETTEDAQDFSAVTEAIEAGFARIADLGRREDVDAGDSIEVNEPAPYRFDGIAGSHSFTEDLRNAQHGDTEARHRLDEFFGEAFAVTSGNVGTLNPTKNRPELYVPQLHYARPLWDMVTTGSLDDKTPFTVPKFASASGLVGDHTEGTEPTPGAFTATSQTVTPGAMSGKIEVNREVLDQGGSPQADQIIWNEMTAAYFDAIEAKIAAALAAVGTAEVNLASATDATLVNAVQNILVGLQFTRGGNRFTKLALDGMLFPALVNAADTTGRKLLPILGPSNAQGDVSGVFDRVSIGGLDGRAAWALGSTNASKSFLFVPSSVYAWASQPKRFTFEYQVKSVDIAIWGYAATAVTRDSDVRPIDYTTADA